ncbi:MAG: hypothetical protein ABFD50_11285 [Smithella sp.]
MKGKLLFGTLAIIALSFHVGIAQESPPERSHAIEKQFSHSTETQILLKYDAPAVVPNFEFSLNLTNPQCQEMAFADALPAAVFSVQTVADASIGRCSGRSSSILCYNYESDYSIPAHKTRNCSTGYWCKC